MDSRKHIPGYRKLVDGHNALHSFGASYSAWTKDPSTHWLGFQPRVERPIFLLLSFSFWINHFCTVWKCSCYRERIWHINGIYAYRYWEDHSVTEFKIKLTGAIFQFLKKMYRSMQQMHGTIVNQTHIEWICKHCSVSLMTQFEQIEIEFPNNQIFEWVFQFWPSEFIHNCIVNSVLSKHLRERRLLSFGVLNMFVLSWVKDHTYDKHYKKKKCEGYV